MVRLFVQLGVRLVVRQPRLFVQLGVPLVERQARLFGQPAVAGPHAMLAL